MIRKPLITESELTSLKLKLEKEKQTVLEIYRIAFDNFLEREFTREFLLGEIRSQMNANYDYLIIRLVNRDNVDIHNVFNLNMYNIFDFKWMIGRTFSNSFSWFFLNRVDIKLKFWKYRKLVKRIVDPVKRDEVIQLSMEEVAEEVIFKSVVYQRIIQDLEKSDIRATGGIFERERFTDFSLFLKWGKEDEINEEK